MEGWQQKDIAATLKKSENTIGKWAKDGRWEESLDNDQQFAQTAVEQTRQLIMHQLKVLNMIKKRQAEAFHDDMEVSELKTLLIDKGETDSLTKLMSTIKGSVMGWDVYVRIITELINFINNQDADLSKRVSPVASEFLNEKRKRV
jgi:hypothetical protein